MVTMQDVANLAGVSLKTVSNVVNGFPSIRPSTRARVEQALKELGYRPNMAARSLAGGKTGLVAVMIPYINSSYFGRLSGSLVKRARSCDLTPVMEESGGTAVGERGVVSHLHRHFVDGLVGASLGLTDAELAEQLNGLPTVILGQRWGGEALLDRVTTDLYQAGRDAVGHLLAQGRRRIALLGLRPEGHDVREGRFRGARDLLEEHQLEPLIAKVAWYDHEHGYRAMQELLSVDPGLNGVFCFNDELAVGALAALRQVGARCPDDVALVGFDDTREGRFASTPLTSISYSTDDLATAAFDRLQERINATVSDEAPRDFVIPHRLMIRESSVSGAGFGVDDTRMGPDEIAKDVDVSVAPISRPADEPAPA